MLIAAAAAFLFVTMGATGFTAAAAVLQTFIPSVEGFHSYPYWDAKQWTWGYGTAAGFDPNQKPKGSISRAQAFKDMLQHLQQDYSYLQPLITRKLNANQWAALLSFSYNAGKYNADNLITNINSGNDAALFDQWRKYVYSNGSYSTGLFNRREKEISLWKGIF